MSDLCFQSVLLAGMVLDVPPHVAGVRHKMHVIMWMAPVRAHVCQGTRGITVTRVSSDFVYCFTAISYVS